MKYILIPILVFSLMSCSSWKFLGEYDKEADFSTYKTFGLLNWNPANDKEISPETKKSLLSSIRDELESRGYTYKEHGADLQVSVFIIVNEETSFSAYSNHYSGYHGYGAVVGVGVSVGTGGAGAGVIGYGVPSPYPYTTANHNYHVGTLIIDLLDHHKKKQVWQGVASGKIGKEQASDKNIRRDIGRLFKSLPVEKIKK